jgi:hypothetical protein
VLGVPIGRRKGLARVAKQVGKASRQFKNAGKQFP